MPLQVESVWDYPRPPKLEPVSERLVVTAFDLILADTVAGFRILETSHPPTYYLPQSDTAFDHLVESGHTSYCEFKGRATYYSISVEDRRIENAAWCYPEPAPPYSPITGFLSFYASHDVFCQVGGEPVIPQPGDFYGGWITRNLRGPFKGGPGTRFW
ncbi:MAG: DUF427 domain-containing protein [Rhizobiaceae bacterium]